MDNEKRDAVVEANGAGAAVASPTHPSKPSPQPSEPPAAVAVKTPKKTVVIKEQTQAAPPAVAKPAPAEPATPSPTAAKPAAAKPAPVKPTAVKPTATTVPAVASKPPVAKPAPVAKGEVAKVAATKVVATPVLPLPLPDVNAVQKPTVADTVMLPRIRARAKSLALLSFFLLVILPTVCVGWYFAKIATPMYVSNAQLAFKKGDQIVNAHAGNFLSALIGGGGPASPDVLIVVSYIRSPGAMADVDAALDLRSHYSIPTADFYSRLPANASQDTFLQYWNKVVVAKVDSESGLLNLSVRAYTPEMAQSIAMILFDKCEQLINQLNSRLRDDSLTRARAEVELSEEKIQKAMREMEEFRSLHTMLDPSSSAGIRLQVIGALESEIATVKAEIASKQPFFGEGHTEMKTLRSKLGALQAQLVEEEAKMASENSNKQTIATLTTEYERKATELTFARKQHEYALTALEAARLQVDTKTTYIVPVVDPILPDESLYPRPVFHTGIFFLINLVVFGLISMIFASIKDHLSV